ncbi:MAG: sulfite exporter TauE/SafE family protein [Spirochaetes bacterium]|nr:sulfite exporter TauE/SafE family protein [Spirochaetota bacterium]
MAFEQYFWLIGLGILVGTFGTLIGAGGGFILMPILLIAYPHARAETITCISLAVVFANSFSGSLAYAKMKRIDYKSGIIFALATVPGAVLGALTTDYIPRQIFNITFGIVMIIAAVYLFFHRPTDDQKADKKLSGHTIRNLIDKTGNCYAYSYNMKTGIIISLFAGYISSLLGIGGGIIHVPALARLLNFPVHIATATSHFVLSIMAFTGTIVHIVTGSFAYGGLRRTIFLSIGVLIGAQIGAMFSKKIQGIWIIRGLASALVFVGIRILVMAFF